MIIKRWNYTMSVSSTILQMTHTLVSQMSKTLPTYSARDRKRIIMPRSIA